MTELFVTLLNIEVTVNSIYHKMATISKNATKIGASVNAELEYGMERWNGKWNETVNIPNSCITGTA